MWTSQGLNLQIMRLTHGDSPHVHERYSHEGRNDTKGRSEVTEIIALFI